MYETFSQNYDRFVNWQSRLAYEMPFLEQNLLGLAEGLRRKPRVLDTACGTGQHAIALAERGYPSAGADLVVEMIAQAQRNAIRAGVDVPFKAAGFGELREAYQDSALFPFDGLLCLGNSLPHLLTEQDLEDALCDFSACLRPDGLLLIQNRNFDAAMARRERWMEPQSHREGDSEWIFLRFYDYLPDGLIQFNVITLHSGSGEGWQQEISSTFLRPLYEEGLLQALQDAGFKDMVCYGDMTGASFNTETSGNLIITARRAG